MTKAVCRWLSFALVAFASSAGAATAQTTTSLVPPSVMSVTGTGYLTNKDGSRVPLDHGLVLLYRSGAAHPARTFATDTDGRYEFRDVPPGPYTIRARKFDASSPYSAEFQVVADRTVAAPDVTVPPFTIKVGAPPPGVSKVFFATDRLPSIPHDGSLGIRSYQLERAATCNGVPACTLTYGFFAPQGLTNRATFVDFAGLVAALNGAYVGNRREVVVYVHGFNQRFEDGYSAAEGLTTAVTDMPVLFYAWPSKHETLKYLDDETNNTWSAWHFADFLGRLATARNGPVRVHLLAHSMGNRLLLNALELFSLAHPDWAANKRIGQVVFAAPDVDTTTFLEGVGPMSSIADRLTLYFSDHDDALALSEHVHGHSRAGQVSSDFVPDVRLDAVDSSVFDCDMFGHGYWSQSAIILGDINAVFHGEPVGGAARGRAIAPVAPGKFAFDAARMAAAGLEDKTCLPDSPQTDQVSR